MTYAHTSKSAELRRRHWPPPHRDCATHTESFRGCLSRAVMRGDGVMFLGVLDAELVVESEKVVKGTGS